MSRTDRFEAERPRLASIAARVLGDRTEAEDVVQEAWLRMQRTETADEIRDLPAWLTTVTTRLCLDRLKARVAEPVEDLPDDLDADLDAGPSDDPADVVALADTVGVALHVVLDRLTPRERIAFVLHDSFGFEFSTIASVLDTTAPAARKLASRARAKVAAPRPRDALADWEVVDAFLAAARGGDLERLLELLAPGVLVDADEIAVGLGTPARIEGRDDVAAFFNGAAATAFPTLLGDRPGAAWYDRGRARVVFDFAVAHGQVTTITFRAEPDVLADVVRRSGAGPRT